MLFSLSQQKESDWILVFAGNRSDPLIVNSKALYMRGALVFDALIEYLTTVTLFKDAEQIILAGSSGKDRT